MTMAAGIGAFQDEVYRKTNCEKIIETREKTSEKLKTLGFILTDSKANFILAKHPRVGGEELYRELKKRNILIRYFDKPRLRECVKSLLVQKNK